VIDLGTTPEPYKPCEPMSVGKPQTYYPSLYIDNKSTSFKDVPDEGVATIKYRVTSRSSNWRDGKEKHGMNIDVLSINPKSKLKELNAILDARLNEFDSRPRTAEGTFESQAQTGMPDPISIKRAYQEGRKDQKRGNMTRGVLAAAAVGAASFGGHKWGKAVGAAGEHAVMKKSGQGLARKAYQAGKNRSGREIEGLGDVIRRQSDKMAIHKEVESENLKMIRDLQKGKKK